MEINNTSLEVLRECKYNKCDIGLVSDNVYISIIATNKCNKSCFYCINSHTDRSKELPVDKALANIRKSVEKYGIKEAVILGGEPTIYNGLFKLIDGLKHLNLRKFGITTNGIKLTKDYAYTKQLVTSGIDWVNISCDDIKRYNKLRALYCFIKDVNKDCKVRINTNIYRGNNDNIKELDNFIRKFSGCCDEMRISNLIYKDEFSVNTTNNETSYRRILNDNEYEALFQELINLYTRKYNISYIVNEKALGFVKYILLPLRVPIIINQNINSKVSEQVCENDIDNKKIHTFKCLVTSDISLSWNNNNIIQL